ncbi:hypothetical protein BCR44DRAFT_1386649 [Catenaria anguillulae PL171]|uniref:Cyclin N-terminal domain-containing protein n=1 Tax=Catenaria anguillulae PL171 TaxID=765915 RepID=A0A1Y2HZR7_9FUNG|nr:hypothetical protein BCR44DRAFT_1386649 [Catenaria anguillulae PL171]
MLEITLYVSFRFISLDVGLAHSTCRRRTQNLEVSSLAKAFVYFEKLVLKRAVIKSNRRLVGAICLLLACKVNEPKESLNIGQLLEAMAKALGKVSVKDMRDNEFAVFAQLEFNLYLPQHEFMPHFERICAIKGMCSLSHHTK